MAQEFLSGSRAPSIREKGVIQNPLAGLVLCGKCGRRMQRRPYLKQGLPPSLICVNTACDNVSSNLNVVEERILFSLRQWLEDYRVAWRREPRGSGVAIEFHQKALAKLEQELSTLSRQREKLYDLLERGVYDADTFLNRREVITVRIQEAEQNRKAIAGELVREQRRETNHREIIPKVEHLLEVYGTLTPAGKNFMLKEVLEKVVYRKDPESRWSHSDDFKIDLFPKVPPSGEYLPELQ